MRNLKTVVLVAVLLLTAVGAMASQFRAADQVYLPAFVKAPGGLGTFWNTDVWISNVSTVPVVVQVAYLPGGNADNRNITTVATLPVMQPGERREINDAVKAIFNLDTANGHAIFFACRQGGNCTNCETNPADCELITVQSRIYNQGAAGTYGQLFPGIPWYSFVSMNVVDPLLSRVFITGIRQSAPGGAWRTNIGVVNASQLSTTQLRLTLFQGNGTPYGAPAVVTLNPLAHLQGGVSDFFPGFTGQGAYVVIEQISATPIPGETNPEPGFLAYGSVTDNATGDPTTLEAQYAAELPWSCVYGSKPQRRLVRRP
jgi:hypothetical protein